MTGIGYISHAMRTIWNHLTVVKNRVRILEVGEMADKTNSALKRLLQSVAHFVCPGQSEIRFIQGVRSSICI